MTVIDNDLDEFFGRPASATVTVLRPPASTVSRPRATRHSRPAPAAPTSTRRARTTARTNARTGSTVRRSSSADRPPRRPAASRPAPPRPSATPRSAAPQRGPRPTPRARPASRPRPALPLVDPDSFETRRMIARRMLIALLPLLIITAAITAKMVDTQVTTREQWMAIGQEKRQGVRPISASRGTIYDRNGQALAISRAQPNVVADPANVTDAAAAAAALAPILEMDVATLTEKLDGDGRYALLQATADDVTVEAVRRLDLDGIAFEDAYVRHNPSGTLASAVVGRTVVDGGVDAETGRQGVSGIESFYDTGLTGVDGMRSYERDPSGRTIAGGIETLEPARPGSDVYLTIDQALQYEAERALGERVADTRAAAGMAVIMRPSTGEILAMASVARHEDGTVTNTADNRAVTAAFEPGSVNKVITMAGAIEEGVVAPDTVLDVPDHLTLYDKTFTDHDPHPTQAWSATDILVTSSNIGTIKIARMLGKDRVDSYLRSFGFGRASGLDFPGESNGIMLPAEEWSGTSIGAIPIGQGISVTALQMLAAYNVIANDGVYVQPRLVAATDDGSGRADLPAGDNRRVVSVDTARAVSTMLTKVVDEGTGKRARVPGYPAGGKTGTARIPQGVVADDGYLTADGRYVYQSSFVGFVAGADLSVIVTIEDAQTSIYGGELAAPLFGHLASTALHRFRVPPPALADAISEEVPELSPSARTVGEEMALGSHPGPTATAG